MKKYLFIAATAIVALASCSDESFVGNNSPNDLNDQEGTQAIVFSSNAKAITRADHVGADAANLLNNKFYVVAFKGNGSSTMSQTFDNYLVEWTANTAGTTQSNTSDWEYVGKTTPAWSGIAGNTQTIKYWDYSNDQYDFIAWSPGTADVVTTDAAAGQVQITKPTAGSYAPSYGIAGLREDLAKCYIADLVTAYKADQTPVQPKFQEEVKFTFRNLACKVRMALYETVPGYSVKDVKFYVDNATTIATGASQTNAHLFTSGTEQKDHFYAKGRYTISFPTIGSSNINASDYNKAHVAFTAFNPLNTKEDFGALTLVGKEQNEANATNYIGRTLPTASYAGAAAPYYKTMLPNEEGTVLELRVDYTLLATDGSGEEIKIHGAKAFVPLIYTQWKPNYAYTYIFKISDNTNGWTSTVDTDPTGLYPITFDAIVVDAEEHQQSTITTVATPSITTYQKGHNPNIDGSVINIDEYDATKGDIYIQVMQDGALIQSLSTSGTNPIQVWSVTYNDDATEADIMDALNIRVQVGNTTIGRNGVTLNKVSTATDFTTIPGADGNNITITAGDAAKFTPTAGTIYAVTYKGTDHDDSYIYSAEALTSQPSDWGTSWYEDPDGLTPVGTFTAGTYYKKFTNRNIDWGVKIIKVIN